VGLQVVTGLASTATLTSMCNDRFCHETAYVPVPGGTSTISCLNSASPLPFSWQPYQRSVTVQECLDPVYLIHQASDLPSYGPPSTDRLPTPAAIAIGVIVPVVVLSIVGIASLLIMKRLKKRRDLRYNAMPAFGMDTLVVRGELPADSVTGGKKALQTQSVCKT